MRKMNLTKTFAMLAIALVAGLLLQSCNKKTVPTQADLQGSWVLKSIKGEKAEEAFKSALPTMDINFQDSIVSGNGGCNRYTGVFLYDKGNFSAPNLAATRMLCMEENKENEFLAELSNLGNSFSIENGVLSVSHDGEVVLEFVRDVNTQTAESAKAQIEPQQLTGEWSLKSINGEEASKKFDHGTVPSLTVNLNENKVNGNSGCNTYNGGFTLDNDQLVVGQVMLTRMSCPDMFYENEYIKALSDTSTISELNENVLTLSKNGTPVLEFIKVVNDSIAK